PGFSNLNYQWQKREGCDTHWVNVPNGTNYNLSVSNQSAATDYRVVVTCTNSGLSDTSGLVSLASVPPCYCTSGATSALYEDITNVTLSTLNNSSPCVGTNG